VTTTNRGSTEAFNALWRDLMLTVRTGFTGQLTLHCNGGRVMKVERREFTRVIDDRATSATATKPRD
jgi:hypothetical protein